MRQPVILLLAVLTSAGAARAEEVNLRSRHRNPMATSRRPLSRRKPVIMINKATEAELIQHENIGSLYAKKVISRRPYDGPEDFKKRSGLPGEKFDKVKDLLDF